MSQSSIVGLELLDQMGMPVLTVLRGIELAAGIHRVAFDISDLSSGSYYCRLVNERGEAWLRKVIISR